MLPASRRRREGPSASAPRRAAACLAAALHSRPHTPCPEQALLAESWLADAAAASSAAAAAHAGGGGAFVPSDPSYSELPRRLSRSAPMRRAQQLAQAVTQLERSLKAQQPADAREAKRAELEEAQAALADAHAATAELQATMEADPLALAPWMSALFDAADAGCRLFDAGGGAWPPQTPSLLELLPPPCAASGGHARLSTWLFRGPERALGAFKRRCGGGAGESARPSRAPSRPDARARRSSQV